MLSLFALSHVQCLVHKVGQVGDRGNRIAIESKDDDSIDEASKWTLVASIVFFCLINLIKVQSSGRRVTVRLLLRSVERVHRGSTGLAVRLNHLGQRVKYAHVILIIVDHGSDFEIRQVLIVEISIEVIVVASS